MLNVAQSNGIVYTGTTTIALTGTTATVTNANLNGGTPTSVNLAGTNGVIYVQSAQAPICSENYTPFSANSTYGSGLGCGNVYVSGYYSMSITIASDNDVIINGNIWPGTSPRTTQRRPDRLAARRPATTCSPRREHFVRVQHPVSSPAGRARAPAAATPTSRAGPTRH